MSHEYCVELVPIFNHLPKESMALISKVAQHRTYKKGYSNKTVSRC